MKYTLTCVALLLTSCSTIPRPDLGTVKTNGKVYEQYQSTLCGVVVGKPKQRVVPSRLDETKESIRKPARWLINWLLPASILIAVAGAMAVVYMQNPKLARLCAVVSIGLFAATILAAAWLIATTFMWLFIPLVIVMVGGIIWAFHKLTIGTRPGIKKEK